MDYCSGAFLLTPRQVFTDLGAFDESFAPAYYEDADYCVRIWASGRRVVYEPRAAALHVEFASSRSASDAIRMQRERRESFVRKHAVWLQRQCAPSPQAVLDARETGPRRPRLLFVDDRVPHVRLGSGYPRSRAIVHAATQLGYHVTLYPVAVPQEPWDEAYRDVPPETELMLGLGPDRLTSFLKDRDGYYDVMMTSRPHNMQLVTPAISSLSDWKRPVLVYDAEALFIRRELGRDHLTGASISHEKARQLIDAEVGLARDCDLILTVSASEGDEFRARGFPHVLTLGNSLDLNPGVRPFHERRGFLFVGAMTDDRSPNVDSALWLCREILPAVQRRLGRGARLTIAGRDGSTKVPHLAHDPSIDLVGMVDDLSPLYDRARVFLAPTRFGAGIPLKVQDAAARGVPVVCTSLLARQLDWRDGVHLLVADDVEEIAARCCALHEDEGLWTRIRQGALARVRDECSPDRFRATLAEAFRLAREIHQASASTGEALRSDSGSRSGLTNGSR